MNKREIFKKTVAWSLIATMVNPAAIAPAFARDSDIYLSTTTGTSTAEPNVLFILGTNDRMNVAEAWREYDPLIYDSHAEYLWNDTTIISAAEQTTEHQDKISDAAPPTNPSSVWGTWSGALNTDRKALWQATLAYAQGTQSGDPGPRSQYRNYWDGSWHFWLPTGVATTDPRLWSVSFNRFRGFIQTIAGSRGGVTFPSSTTANYTATNDYRPYNLCTTSFTQIEPSTIFAPTGRPQNAGYMLNQQWLRYEPYLNLAAINNPTVNYPGSHATYVATNGTTYYTGFLNNTAANAVPPTNGPVNAVGGIQGSTNSFRDSLGGNVGSVGQPIRVRIDIPNAAAFTGYATNGGGTANVVDAGDSYAGWTDPAADLGGFTFQSYVVNATAGYYYPTTVLTALRTTAYGGSYSLPAFALSTVPLQEQFAAFRGNRDLAPAFGMRVGSPAYYDISSGLRGAAQTQCDAGTGVAVANQCINLTGVNQLATITRTCTFTAPKLEFDATNNTRYSGATCVNAAAPPICVTDPRGLACVGLTPPTCAVLSPQTSFYTRAYNSTVINTGSCTWGASQSNVAVVPCAWSGRQTVYIEGQGNYYYGGTCTESGVGTSTSAPNPNSSCQLGGGTWVAARSLNGATQNDVIGPFANPVTGAQQATGCGNKALFPAGNYASAGTCTLAANSEFLTPSGLSGAPNVSPFFVNSPGPATAQRTTVAPIGGIAYPTIVNNGQCQTSGGTASISIRGAAGKVYNISCGTLGNNDETCLLRYGAACTTTNAQATICPATITANPVAIAGGNNFYQTYQLNATQNNLYHECLADNGTGNNPGNGYPTAQPRTFGTNPLPPALTNANTTYAGGTAAQRTAPYDTTVGRGVVADATKNIDVYSTNYLNFLYGAKACRDSTGTLITTSPVSTPPAGATCSPIGRKTRLQVAKDALSGLVNTTDGVRLGLMVYNKTQGCNATDGTAGITQGTVTAGSNSLTVVNGATFNSGNAITILGAGPGAANLNVNITAKVGNVYTLSATASTAVAGAQVQANGAYPNNTQLTVIDPTQFIAGAAVTVKGAGAAGVDLVTTISSVAGSVYTLAAGMSTGVNNAAVQLTACAGGNQNDGGNIAYAIHRMGVTAATPADPDLANRVNLVNKIQSVVASSRTPLTETMYEAYRYYSGRTPKWGTSNLPAGGGGTVTAGYDASVGANVDPATGVSAVVNLISGGKYNSPMLNNPNVAGPANCQKNYIVMLTNGQPEEDSAANADIKTMAFAGATGATVAPRTDFDTNGATPNHAGAPDYLQIPTVAGGNPFGPTDAAGTAVDGGYVWLDELTYFMSVADVSPGAANFQSEYSNCSSPSGTHTCDTPTTTDSITGRQSINTYTIGFAGVSAPVVQNTALVAGGVYYVAQNAQQLQAALVAAFVAIKNWSPTAAAATVPISSLNRGQSSNDIYLAFFGPSIQSVWPGTVKKYQLSTFASDCGIATTSAICLLSQSVIASTGLYNIVVPDPITGQGVVDPTSTSGANDIQHPPGSAWYANTLHDGALPTKGGTGHVLINNPAFTPDMRKIYTYLTNSVTLYTSASNSSTVDLTATSNAVDYITNGSNILRCRMGDSAACVGTPAMSLATKEMLLSYIRGGNMADSNCTDGSTGTVCTTWSTWPHSGVEHSKPAVVTYDSSTSPPVQYMFYAQNNGMMTAVDTHTGQEKWSFLIEEALPKIAALALNHNNPEIYLADASPAIFIDDQNGDGIINGADRVWLFFGLRRGGRVYYALDITQKDTPKFKWKITNEQPTLTGDMTAGNNRITVGDKANFAVGMTVTVTAAGPGGSDLTATISSITGGGTHIDLSSNAGNTVVGALVTAVGSPLAARICNGTSSCTTAGAAPYSELGQTWSVPAIIPQMRALVGLPNNPPALIFGGGYDPAEDTVPPGARAIGRAVYIVNADTGAVLKSFGAGQGNVAGDFRNANMMTTYAVPSDVTAINSDFDAIGYVDRLYVGDMGGNIWRFDVDDASTANWKGEMLASLSNNPAGEPKRKFFFPPTAAPQAHPFRFDAVYVGSGDKEHPLLTQSTTPAIADDRFFMLMDDPSLNSGGGTPNVGGPSVQPTPSTLATLYDIANIATTGVDSVTQTVTPNSLTGRQGWFRRLDVGEKVVNTPSVFLTQTGASHVTFGTYAPLAQLNACTPPGEGRLNEIDSLTGNLLALNAGSASLSRYFTNFLTRGFMSNTQMVILPAGAGSSSGSVGSGAGASSSGAGAGLYTCTASDGSFSCILRSRIGMPTKTYWYLEPEQ